MADDGNDQDLRAAAARGVLWSAVATIGSRLLSTVVFVVLARLLDPDDFGLMALAAVFVAVIGLLVEQGVSPALVQRREVTGAHLASAFWLALAGGVVFMGLGLLLAGPVAGSFGQSDLAPILRALTPTFVLTALAAVPQAVLQRDLAFDRLAARSLAAALVGGGAGVGAAFAGAGVWSLVTMTLVQAAVGTAVVWTATAWRPSRSFSVAHARDLLGFSGAVVASGLVNLVNRRADDLLVGWVLGPVALGLYSIAYRLLLVLTDVLTRTITQVAFPVFSRLQGDRPRLAVAWTSSTRLGAAAGVPAFVGLAVVAPEAIEVVFGDVWTPAAPAMRWLAVAGALHAVLLFDPAALLGAGRPGTELRLTALNAVANVVAFSVAVRHGITSVAAAYALRGLLLAPVELAVVARALGTSVRAWIRAVAAPLVATAAMAAAVAAVRIPLADADPAVRLGLAVVTGAAVYWLLAWRLAPDVVARLRTDLASVRRPSEPRVV